MEQIDASERSFYDVVVVGSGYGGSVAAFRLSMAGFDVCLLEKGRRWRAQDFPTRSSEMVSATRIESRNTGLEFGSKDALYQIVSQDDSIAVTACGLGGGSLINAGVLLPPSLRARRDPKWPKAWEDNWDQNVASALDILKGQSIPNKFRQSEIMEAIVGDEEYDKSIDNNMKLTVNFDMEDKGIDRGNCVACGNCVTGCPYNAKLSNDKTYLELAIQAGCDIITECEVQYVVRNEDYGINGRKESKSKSRWMVFLDDFDYIECNIVILSAGVFGTTKILFRSQLRGLLMSPSLGSGFSCNGNAAAFLANSSAPLNATGFNEKQLSNIPFRNRPGPSISSALTSSLGFTIQSAVFPRAYPRLLFTGLAAYGLGSGHGLFYGIIDMLRRLLGFQKGEDVALNVMGHDDSNGKLTFQKETNKVMFQPPVDHLLPKKLQALGKLAAKLGGVLFVPQYRSASVHLLGGCIAESDASAGVCNPNGQVFDASSSPGVHLGLYICDASIIPTSLGINPCLTIAAVAEHISRNLIRDLINETGNLVRPNLVQKQGSLRKMNVKRRLKVEFNETMRGQIGGMQCAAYLELRFGDSENANKVTDNLLQGKASGYIEFGSVEMGKMYIIRGEVDLCETKAVTPYAQYMHYHLLLAASSSTRYELDGIKIMNPYLLATYAWHESTTLNVTLKRLTSSKRGDDFPSLDGKLHISCYELLKTIWSIKGGRKLKFVSLLMQSLLRTYILQIPTGSHMRFNTKELIHEPYPRSIKHEVETEDGVKITLLQWECNHSDSEINLRRKRLPVLLLNGYATESYCLPTEKTDFVRNLLKDGHDVWLLHARMHWSIASNDFSVEDIGKFDVPAAINRMIEFYGNQMKIHVIAHCLGGLAIHICLMDGRVLAEHIASLSCTNSSMFYKVTMSSLVKLWLPLIPISMAILGKNTVIPMLEDSTTSFRHKVVKHIARLLPRYERCTCEECNVFSGIFGSAYWHENISPRMHYWMHKVNLPRLPLSAFPHIRKICKAGFIVDNKGENRYLIHPERMALPTLYISGGRTILVDPKTSFLAHKYMKMHQPSFRHERVVVHGYGHSDLWIGEKSDEAVFPHIQKHIRLAEEEGTGVGSKGRIQTKETLAWSIDSYENDGRLWSWISSLITILLCVVVFMLL